jgi:hypothetical protein
MLALKAFIGQLRRSFFTVLMLLPKAGSACRTNKYPKNAIQKPVVQSEPPAERRFFQFWHP